MAVEKTLVVVAYDIPDNARRQRMAKLLLGFGGRIQGSVYELWLNNRDIEVMWGRLSRVAQQDDLVRCYLLCGACEKRIRTLNMQQPSAPVAYIV